MNVLGRGQIFAVRPGHRPQLIAPRAGSLAPRLPAPCVENGQLSPVVAASKTLSLRTSPAPPVPTQRPLSPDSYQRPSRSLPRKRRGRSRRRIYCPNELTPYSASARGHDSGWRDATSSPGDPRLPSDGSGPILRVTISLWPASLAHATIAQTVLSAPPSPCGAPPPCAAGRQPPWRPSPTSGPATLAHGAIRPSGPSLHS